MPTAASRYVMAFLLAGCAAEPSRPTTPAAQDIAVPPQPTPPAVAPQASAPPTGEPSTPAEIDLVARAAAAPGCRVRGEPGALVRSFDLRFRGRPFATVSGKVDGVEITLAGAPATGQAVVRSPGGTFAGEVSGDRLHVRPRSPILHEGWLGVRVGSVRAVRSDSRMELRVALPPIVHAKERSAAVDAACDEVSLTGAVASAPAATGSSVVLMPGAKAPLRSEPSGAAFAELVVPAPPTAKPGLRAATPVVTATLLVRRGKDVKIRVHAADAWVEGWTDAGVLDKKKQTLVGGLLGSLTGMGLSEVTTLKCPRETPVFVREGADVARVGVIAAGAAIHARAPPKPNAPPEEVKVDLGLAPRLAIGALTDETPNALEPFVRGAALEGCSAEPPRT